MLVRTWNRYTLWANSVKLDVLATGAGTGGEPALLACGLPHGG
jgi:hypothetical protein